MKVRKNAENISILLLFIDLCNFMLSNFGLSAFQQQATMNTYTFRKQRRYSYLQLRIFLPNSFSFVLLFFFSFTKLPVKAVKSWHGRATKHNLTSSYQHKTWQAAGFTVQNKRKI